MFSFALLVVVLIASVMYSHGFAKDMDFNFTSPLDDIKKGQACQIQSYVLAIQYECSRETIHGLWPDPDSTCSSCTSEVFSESKISSGTLSKMNKYWPTCQGGNTNDDFWSHEWSKHGTCSGLSQDAYFTQGISLYEEYYTLCPSSASTTTTCKLCFTPQFKYTGKC